jgi:ABC-2 type transport system permease protein
MTHPNRMAAIVLRHFYLLRSSPARALPLFAWYLIDIVLWGFITRYLETFAAPGFHFVPTLLGAVLLWDFFTRVLLGVTTVFFEDVWSRNFLNIFASPLEISEYLSGLVLSSIATSLAGLIVMLVLASLLFGLSFFALGLALVPFLLELFLFGITMGIVGCAIVLRYGPAAEWLIWPIPAVISPFAAVFYPVATLPIWMRPIARILPPSYVFENLRQIVSGRPASGAGLFVGAALVAIYVLLACWCFTRVYRHAVRTGLIARYSAETVS